MNLILDVDGTLIDKDDDGEVIERPHLKEFLSFVFSHFQTVSLWTSATPRWLNKVMTTVLDPAIPEGKSFYFIWTREMCVHEKIAFDLRPRIRKPLSLVFATFPLTHTAQNTIIVDDSPETYELNQSCAVPIAPYKWGHGIQHSDDDFTADSGPQETDSDDDDQELLRLIEHFKSTYF